MRQYCSGNRDADPGARTGWERLAKKLEGERDPGDEDDGACSRFVMFRVSPGEVIRFNPPGMRSLASRPRWYRRVWAWLRGRA